MSAPAAHVLLMPEDFAGRPPAENPVYGTVIASSGATSTVGLLSAPHSSVQVPSALARARQVTDHDHANGAIGEWLRKPVVGISEGAYVYGQLVAYDGSYVTIRTASGLVQSIFDDIQEVAPVLCFLLAHSRFEVDDLSLEELADHHTKILDRLLGPPTTQANRRSTAAVTRGQATRSFQRLLSGILPGRQHPDPTDTLPWINASTGVTSTVSYRHAVDYAYYVDGDRPVPRNIQPTIGASFDDDPLHAAPPTGRTATVSSSPGGPHLPPSQLPNPPAASDDALGQLEALLDAVHPPPGRYVPSTLPPAPPSSTLAVDQASHAKVLAAIADKPDLVRFYLGICASHAEKRRPQHEDDRPTQRRRLEAASDILETNEPAERRSKHDFTPTRVQQAINQMLLATEYKGKDTMFIVDAMISSRATKFKPVPAIIIRVFAFEFGARGLSIMHFSRLDFATRRAWYASATANLNNFSASVALPKAERPKSLDDVSNAMTVLHVFVEEFMDSDTSRLVSSSREFIEELRSYCPWTPSDVETLTFWFDSLFESYRSATEYDSRHGTVSRNRIRDKLTLQDPDLQSVLYVIQSERLASLMPAPSRSVSWATVPRSESGRSDSHRSSTGSRPPPKTPREVIDALPRRGRQTVCMKYLAAGGCVSKSDDRCAFPNHAHFIPDGGLPPVVYKHIEEKMGGVRRELKH